MEWLLTPEVMAAWGGLLVAIGSFLAGRRSKEKQIHKDVTNSFKSPKFKD